MAMKFMIQAGSRQVIPDGTSTTVTVDFSEDLARASVLRDRTPDGIYLVLADVQDVDQAIIPFSSVLHGKKLTLTYERPPAALNVNGAPNVFGVAAYLTFSTD